METQALWRRLFAGYGRAATDEDAPGELFVSFSADSWRMRIVAEGKEVFSVQGENENASAAAPDTLRIAIRALPSRQRDLVGKVTLVVCDPAIDLVDNRFARVRTTDAVAIRQFGAQQLRSSGATFAFIPFGLSSERETRRGVYAFLSVERCREYFTALDTLATKLTRIVPAASLLIAASAAQPFAALEIRRSSSRILLADPQTGTVTSRELDIGIRTLVAAVADATSVSMEEAFEGLQRRDCFSGLGTPTGAASRPPTATARAIRPVLDTFAAAVKESIDYFTFYRIASPPVRLTLLLDADRLNGFPAWLERTVELPVVIQGDLLERLAESDDAAAANLLEGAPDGLLRIGKSEYSFVKGRFRPVRPAMPGRRMNLSTSDLLETRINLALLRQLWAEKGKARVAIAGGAALAVAAVVWFTAASGTADLVAASQTLSSVLVEDGSLGSALAQHQRALRPDDGANRFLVTDTLLRISRALPNEVRLTNLFFEKGTDPKASQRLLLEGVIPPDVPDPMSQVNEFVDRLAGDVEFMRDFRTVSLDGVSAAYDGNDRSIHFSVSAWFDPARRRDLVAGPTGVGRS
jgi:hypothetical protein